jgi:hypothetical protein
VLTVTVCSGPGNGRDDLSKKYCGSFVGQEAEQT